MVPVAVFSFRHVEGPTTVDSSEQVLCQGGVSTNRKGTFENVPLAKRLYLVNSTGVPRS